MISKAAVVAFKIGSITSAQPTLVGSKCITPIAATINIAAAVASFVA